MNRNYFIAGGGFIAVVLLIYFFGTLFFHESSFSGKKSDNIKEKEPTMNSIERIELTTKDGVHIVGDVYGTANMADAGIIYLHMMPAARQSFSGLAAALQKAGYPGIAIDLRGHGESEGGPNGYKMFKDEEHQKSIEDVRAAAELLKTKEVKNIYLIGASIGANLSLEYLAESPDAKAAALLSPGLEYRGINTESLLKNVSPGKAVYLIAADDDAYSADSIRKLFDEAPKGVMRAMTSYRAGGHGTALFQTQPKLTGELVQWIQSLKK